MKLAEFLETYREAITDAVIRTYPPVYDEQTRRTTGFDLRPLLRKPMGAQADAIRATALSIQRQSSTIVVGEMGVGKASPLDTPVLSPTGWKPMGAIHIGDKVIGSDGRPTEVLGVFPQGERPIYRVSFSDGASVECDEEHLWQVQTPLRKWRGRPSRVLTTRQIMEAGLRHGNGNLQHFVPLVQPVQFDDPGGRHLNPYLLGVLLGDGCLTQSQLTFSSASPAMVASLAALLPAGTDFVPASGYSYRFRGLPLRQAIESLGLAKHDSVSKFIPECYLRAPVPARVALLQGLLDTDGCAAGKFGTCVEYTTVSPQLAEGVVEIVRSLGGVARTIAKQPSYVHRGERRQGQLAYRIVISLPPDIPPFRLPEKAARYRALTKYQPTRAISAIEPVGIKPAQCIQVASEDQLYVTKDYIVTHNTMVATAAAYLAGCRRVFVMCPPHLVRKWQREIEHTVPGARAMIVRTPSDLERARWLSGGSAQFVICSREQAKLGYRWRPAVVERVVAGRDGRAIRDDTGAVLRLAACPSCFTPVVDDDGVPLTSAELEAKKRSCAVCGGALWQADRAGPRRVALADYVLRRMRGAFDLLIVDECFPAGTRVATPTGSAPIEQLRVGDRVLSYRDGVLVERTIVRTIRKRLRQSLVRVWHEGGSFTCTPNHRIYTASGAYREAGSLTPGTPLVLLEANGLVSSSHVRGEALANHRKAVPAVSGALHHLVAPQAGATVLQPDVRGQDTRGKTLQVHQEAASDCCHPMRVVWRQLRASAVQVAAVLQQAVLKPRAVDRSRTTGARLDESAEQDGCTASSIRSAHGRDQSEPNGQGQDGGCAARSDVPRPARRQWPADATAGPTQAGPWLVDRVVYPDGTEIVALRQGRPGRADAQDRHRDRRGVASHRQAEEPRRPQDGHARGIGLDGPPVLECGNRPAVADGARQDPRCRPSKVLAVERLTTDDAFVYDLEVEDTHRYFADGVLVSNCHEVKGKGTAQGLAAAALAEACARTLILTGTLLGGYSSTLFHLLYRFSPHIRAEFGHGDEAKWVSRYGYVARITRKDPDVRLDDGRQSKRRTYPTRVVEKPGVTPGVLFHLIGNSVFLRLPDVASQLPPYTERIHVLPLDEGAPGDEPSQAFCYRRLSSDLRAAVSQALARGSKRLLGTYLQALLAWPDGCTREETVLDPRTNEVIGHAPALPDDRIYPKERAILDLALRERERGRRVLVYLTHTDTRDLTPRLRSVLEARGLRVAVLKADTVPAERREEWVAARVREGVHVLLANPRLVQTGLDLVDFPSLVWAEVDYSVYVLRQASRRSWRIGQRHPVEVSFMVYDQTLQAEALSLVAAKTRASLMVEGELPEEGLAALDGDGGDVFLALARKLADPSGAVADERSLEALFAAARASEHVNHQLVGDEWCDAEDPTDLDDALHGPDQRLGGLPPPSPSTPSEEHLGRVIRFDQLAEALRRQKRGRSPRTAPGQLGLFAA